MRNEPTARRAVEVAVIAHDSEVMYVGGEVLVGVIKIQPEADHRINHSAHLLRMQADHSDARLQNHVSDELSKQVVAALPQQEQPDRVEG